LSLYILISNIVIRQVPSTAYPNRKAVFEIPYCSEISIDSSWDNLTDTARIVLPAKSYFFDDKGQRTTLFGNNVYGSKVTAPLIMRGDTVSITLGYRYNQFGSSGKTIEDTAVEFVGYITRVDNSVPVEIHCEDGMYALGQIQCPTKSWKGYTLETMLKELLAGSVSVSGNGATAEITVETNGEQRDLGDFKTGSETVRAMLNDLRRQGVEAYFRIDEEGNPILRAAGLAYVASDRREHVFHRQKNVVDDNLTYNRTDDQKVGIRAVAVAIEQNGTRADGNPKTKRKRLEVIVPEGYDGSTGDIRTYHYIASSESQLRELATVQLGKMFAEGFRGNITAFGIPSVRHGDAIVWENAYVQEQNGTYLVKSVKKTFGQRGYRQVIELDRRIDG
jgi:hypothetical protein